MVRNIIGLGILYPLLFILGMALTDSATHQYASQYILLKLSGPPPHSCEVYPVDPRDILDKLTVNTIFPNITLTCKEGFCPSGSLACANWTERSINMNPPTLLTKKEPALRYLVAHEIGHLVPGYSQNVANNIIEQTRADKFALTLLGPDAFREGYRIYGDPDHKINEEIKNLYAFQPEPMFHAWGIIRESLLDLWEPLGITKPPPVILVKYAGEVPTGIFLLDKTPFVSISFYDLARQIRVSKDPETSARIFAARTATLYKFYLQNEGRTPETEKEKTIFDAEALRACMFVTRTECSEK